MERTHSFGYWLRRRRKALDLTQAELAQRASCSLELIQKIEADSRRPSRQMAAKLADVLGVDASERAEFVQAARAERAVDAIELAAQPLDQPQRSSHTNLPAQLTSLIGREQEIDAVITVLRQVDARLVTLTGPGGVGKTRLSLEVGAELAGDFAQGVHFVDLAPIREPALVTSAIAAALGMRESAGQPLLASLKDYLREKQLLLLLDNFEQVLDAAPLVAELLAAAPQLKALVTSREMLRLRGEQEIVVPPLALPPADDRPFDKLRAGGPTTGDRRSYGSVRTDMIVQYAAVALFVERARANNPTFQITYANAGAVAEICAWLDGLPLAIELAAARIKLFGPEALLARLSSRLGLLTGGPRDLPVRQQTIRSTIAWSYDLLSEEEQMLFRRLGVFVGGWTLEAAEKVLRTEVQGLSNTTLNAVLSTQHSVLEGVAALLDKSLVRRTGEGDEPRFTMLETIREYALERLQASGELNAAQAQHAAYFLALAQNAEAHLQGPDQVNWLDRLEADNDNLRAALNWYERTAGAEDRELRLASALSMFWIIRGYPAEGLSWLERALTCTQGVVNSVRATALNRIAWLHFDYATSRAFYQESLAISQAIGDKRNIAYALRGLGNTGNDTAAAKQLFAESLALFREIGDMWGAAWVLSFQAARAASERAFAQADRLFTESLTLARQQGDSWLIGTTLLSAGEKIWLQGNCDRANELLEEGLALTRTAHNRQLIAAILMRIGHVARTQGDDTRATACYNESLMLARQIGDQLTIAMVQHNRTFIALHRDDIVQATTCIMESLAICRAIGNENQMAWSLAALGGIAVAKGQPERAAWLLGVAETHFKTINQWISESEQAEHTGYADAARAQLGEAAFDAAWAAGAATPIAEVTAQVLDEAA